MLQAALLCIEPNTRYPHPNPVTNTHLSFCIGIACFIEMERKMNANEFDNMDQNQLLMNWQKATTDLLIAKEYEMNMRKHIVGKLFPNAKEGTNNFDLGNGYKLTAVVKFNYKFESNDKIQEMITKFELINSDVYARLVKYKPEPSVTEYQKLTGQHKVIADSAIVITDATPSLEIKAPK